MSNRKFITLKSYRTLEPTGDFYALELRYFLSDNEEWTSGRSCRAVVRISGTLLSGWEENYPELREKSNLEKVLIYFAKIKVKERVEKLLTISSDEEFPLLSYDNYIPPNPDLLQITMEKPEEISVIRKFGFQNNDKN